MEMSSLILCNFSVVNIDTVETAGNFGIGVDSAHCCLYYCEWDDIIKM